MRDKGAVVLIGIHIVQEVKRAPARISRFNCVACELNLGGFLVFVPYGTYINQFDIPHELNKSNLLRIRYKI